MIENIRLGDKVKYKINKFISSYYRYFHNHYLEEGKIYTVSFIGKNNIELVGFKFIIFDRTCFKKVLWIEEYKDD